MRRGVTLMTRTVSVPVTCARRIPSVTVCLHLRRAFPIPSFPSRPPTRTRGRKHRRKYKHVGVGGAVMRVRRWFAPRPRDYCCTARRPLRHRCF